MIYIGLLTHDQKQHGYFVAQTEDFIFLYHGHNTDKPECVAIFLYQSATVREIREKAQEHLEANGN